MFAPTNFQVTDCYSFWKIHCFHVFLSVGTQTFDFACFHYFSEQTSALKIIPIKWPPNFPPNSLQFSMPIKYTLMKQTPSWDFSSLTLFFHLPYSYVFIKNIWNVVAKTEEDCRYPERQNYKNAKPHLLFFLQNFLTPTPKLSNW